MKKLLYSTVLLMLVMFLAGANSTVPFVSIQAIAQYDDTGKELEPEPTPEPDPGM